jgi:hypothetical protein
MIKTRMKKNSIISTFALVLMAAVLVAAGCSGESERQPKLDVQVIGWGPGPDGNVGFQAGLPTFREASKVRVNLTHPGTHTLLETRSFNAVESGAYLPSLRFGEDLRLEFDLIDVDGTPLASGATTLFTFREDEVLQSIRIQVDAVDDFAPVGSVVKRDGRSELTQTRMDKRAVRGIDEERWLGRVGHQTVTFASGNKALVVGGAHIDPIRRPAGLPTIKYAHDDLMEFDPRTGYFTDLSYDPDTGSVREGFADRLLEARVYHTVTPIGGDKFVVIGGFASDSGGARALNSIELIDLNAAPGTRVQQIADVDDFKAALVTPRAFHTATYRQSDHAIVIAGGVGRGGANDVLSSVEVLDLNSGTVREVGNLSDARAEHEAVLMGDGDAIWLLGGRNDIGALASTEVITGSDDDIEISPKASMNSARYGFAALRVAPNNGKLVMVLGGYTDLDGSVTDTFEFSSLARDQFLTEGSWRLGEGRGNPVAVELPNTRNIAVIGGRDSAQRRVTSAEVLEFGSLGDARPYNPRTLTGKPHNARVDFSATRLSNGKVLMIGGVGQYREKTTTLDSAEYFTPRDPRDMPAGVPEPTPGADAGTGGGSDAATGGETDAGTDSGVGSGADVGADTGTE